MRRGGSGGTGLGRGVGSPLFYVSVTLLVTAAGAWAAARAELGQPGAVGAGAGAAWAIQAAAVWALVGKLDAGRPVLRVWVAGMGARLGGLALVFVAGATTALPTGDLLLAYGVEILALLLLEAAWLAWRGTPGVRAGARGGRAEREDRIGAG